MLGIDRNAARYTWTAALVVLLLIAVYLVRQTLFIFVLALLFAYLLSPLVNLLDRVLPASRTRTPALALAYVIFVGAVVMGGIQIGSRVVEQADALAKSFPATLKSWQQPTPAAPPTVNSLKQQVLERMRQEVVKHSNDMLSAVPQASLKILSVLSNAIFVVIIPVLAFFFLKDAEEARQRVLELVADGPRRALLDDLMADIHLLLAHYIRALVVLSLATFVAYSIFLTVLGMPYGILLSVLAAALEFIPMVGPLTAAAAILLVGGISGASFLAMLIFLVAYRMFQDYILSPHLMGQGVELHPLAVLFGVFAGAEIAGIAGTFLSVPLLALIRILYVRMRRARTRAKLTETATTVLSE
jgi:predicted PurR-regulated permease PerM